MSGNHDEPELLTYKEVAELWRVSIDTVRRRVKAGQLPVVRIGPHLPRVRADVARAGPGDATLVVDNVHQIEQRRTP